MYNPVLKLATIALSLTLILLTADVFRALGAEAPSDLDPTFGGTGLVVSDVGPLTEEINDIAIQPDGKIVAAAWYYVTETRRIGALFRYTANGELDPTFGSGGKVLSDLGGRYQSYEGIVIQPDGKIVVVGQIVVSATVTQYLVARYNPDGSADNTFGVAGVVMASVGGSPYDGLQAVTLQPDGKIVAAGFSKPSTPYECLTMRLLTNGALDGSFGGTGIVTFNYGDNSAGVEAIAIDHSGRMIAAGSTNRPAGRDIALAVLNTDGTFDSSFGTDGKVVTATPSSEYVGDMKLTRSGKIVVGGFYGSSYFAARYLSNGMLDTSFAGSGIAYYATGGQASEIEVQYDDKVIVGGISSDDLTLVRFLSTGAPDPDFGTNGIRRLAVTPGSVDGVDAVALQPDGKIVIGGGTLPQGESEWRLVLARFIGDPVVNSLNTSFDYDADGRSDISIFRPSSGAWYLQRSRDGLFGTEFGYSTDKITPADYDGDGKTDIAVYRPETGIWYVFRSSDGTVDYHVFGLAEDLPTPADYDGDGKADISVFRPSTATWYRQNSSDGSFYAIQFGASQDKPTIGDFDGDGKSDIAIFRPSVGDWYQLYSSDLSVHGQRFGFGTDIIVPADYDGDGHCDIAVFRPSTGLWYILSSSNGEVVYTVFGLEGDIPAPGDFDGDGKADVSVFRPTDGTWYRTNSSDGSFYAYPFGTAGDKPTQTAFRY